MKPEPLTKEKMRQFLSQDEEGRWVIHRFGFSIGDIKSAVQLAIKEIDEKLKELETDPEYPNPNSYVSGMEDGLLIAKSIIKKAFSGVINED